MHPNVIFFIKTMHDYHIAIIDDNKAVLQSLKLVLEGVFARVSVFSNPAMLPSLLAGGRVDAVLLDMNFNSLKLDGQEGLTWLRYIKERPNPPAVVLITAFGDINLAVNSLKEGAEDFVSKPWDNDVLVNKLLKAIEKCAENKVKEQKVKRADMLMDKQKITRQMTLDELEKQHILDALAECEGNIKAVAARLGVSRTTLYTKLKKYGIEV